MSGEYYLGLKRKEIPTPATTQINLSTFCSGVQGGNSQRRKVGGWCQELTEGLVEVY